MFWVLNQSHSSLQTSSKNCRGNRSAPSLSEERISPAPLQMKPVGARGVEPSEKARAAAVHRRGQAGGEAVTNHPQMSFQEEDVMRGC